MARSARFLKNGVCYYLKSEGIRGQVLFKDNSDFNQCLFIIEKHKERHTLSLYAFCIMPNTLHLIVHPYDSNKISLFMQGIKHAYAVYFNAKYRRQGKVWGDRFKSFIICDEFDLARNIKELEFLPVRANKALSPMHYQWSSCSRRVIGHGNLISKHPPQFSDSKIHNNYQGEQ